MRRRALLASQGGTPPQPPFEDGTEQYPFLIRTADDFVAFQNQINAGDAKIGIYYKLVNNTDLADKTFNALTTYRDFGGHCDGDYHVISNLTKNITYSAVFSLFQSATVRRVGFENISLSGQNPSLFGSGVATTEVRECYVTGQINKNIRELLLTIRNVELP